MKRINQILSTGVLLLAFNYCSSQKTLSKTVQAQNSDTRHILLRDEGKSQLIYVDLGHPDKNWYETVPPGRDMQLVGKGKVLIGTEAGYEERDIVTGKKLFELNSFPGTVAAHRLRDGNTLLTGIKWQGKEGIVLVEVDSLGAVKHVVNFPGFDYVRLVRETASGNFLITSNTLVFEGTRSGNIVWSTKISGVQNPHTWQALRLANGQTLVSAGFSKNFQLFSLDGKLVDTITGPPEANPNFYAGFQILANGNYVVANWQGHGPTHGASGMQVLEYDPQHQLVWHWQQDAAKISSLQAVIILDGLDTNFLNIEDADGKLAPVKIVKRKNGYRENNLNPLTP